MALFALEIFLLRHINRLVFFILVFFFSITLCAQKKALSFSDYSKWPQINLKKISNDGKVALYGYRSSNPGGHLVISAIDVSWKKEISNANNAIFSDDSKFVAFSLPNDSLGIFDIENKNLQYISNVTSFRTTTDESKSWLIYLTKSKEKELIVRNLEMQAEVIYPSVFDYKLSENGKLLIFKTEELKGEAKYFNIYVHYINCNRTIRIWKGINQISNIEVDSTATHIAFIETISRTREIENQIRYYDSLLDSAIVVGNRSSPGLEKGFEIYKQMLKFSKDGKKLFFMERRVPDTTSLKSKVPVSLDVWSYKDPTLQQQQLYGLNQKLNNSVYLSTVDLCSKLTIRLQKDDDQVIGEIANNSKYILMARRYGGNYLEYNWNVLAKPDIYLVSINTGQRVLVKSNITPTSLNNIVISPSTTFVVYFDSEKRNYFSYDIRTGITRNITQSIKSAIFDLQSFQPVTTASTFWTNKDNGLIIQGKYDIWQIDPLTKDQPVCLTGKYGEKNRIILRILETITADNLPQPTMEQNGKVVLLGFSEITKKSSFYSIKLGSQSDLTLLSTSAHIYDFPIVSSNYIPRTYPIKAKDKSAYLVERKSDTESPNVFFTSDFKTFAALSHLAPQNEYNWLSAELVTWRLFNGKLGHGILYKPENFNPQKKYPIIFSFYESQSNELYNFLTPKLCVGDLDVPYFVSNGYLVFRPDIYYEVGNPGSSAYSSVVSAARFFSHKPWVDGNKMALHGLSFGAYEVNYIISHTNLFAVASESSGASDFISSYGSLNGWGASLQFQTEIGQKRLNASLWEAPNLYIKNSPIFFARSVNTPLLMMHNIKDVQVPWGQAIEWFTALRRLKKKVWLLQYDTEGHGIREEINQLDFYHRLVQFYDYYLKGAFPPRWMVQGIPAEFKGKELRLEMDSTGEKP
ncbi:MAG TPA: prolyl oligopeptidase family serine peptidase [Puia sp.]|jgi:dipeptidyl aminopeptidase/acylaminoacyl peptidase